MTPGEQSQTAPAWLNDSFLQDVVQNGQGAQTKILSSRITFDSGIGDHYLSTMYRVTLRVKRNLTEEEEKDIHILIKALPAGDVTQKLLMQCEMFSREIKMFGETLPAIRRLFDTRNCTEYEDIGAKHFYHTPDMKAFVVENLAPKGFKMVNRLAGLDLNHSLLVMKQLGRYHASSIVLRWESPELIESYPKHPVLFDSAAINNFIKSPLKALSTIVQSWPNGEFYSQKLLRRVDTFKNDFEKILECDPNGYNVLIHGDLWMNNMLFRYDDATSDVKEVRFVDFQLPCLNSPAIDLHYFIYTSPTEDVRSAHSEDLLKEYHKALCDTLEKLGYPEKAISIEALKEECEKKALESVYALLIIFPIVNANPNDAMDVEESIKDNDGDSALLSRLTGEYVTKVLKKYIPIFIEKGLL